MMWTIILYTQNRGFHDQAEYSAAVVTGQGFVFAAEGAGCHGVSNGACCNNQAGNQPGKPASYGDHSDLQWVDGAAASTATLTISRAVSQAL